MSLLEISGLGVEFDVGGGKRVRAVNGVSLSIEKGESVGLVGESGCGKTSLGKAVIGLNPVSRGTVKFDGLDIAKYKGRGEGSFRKRVQMVFQDPFDSLNPRMMVGDAVAEVLRVHGLGCEKGARGRKKEGQIAETVEELFRKVGLEREHTARYPHEFSGGQRQRVGIARAIALGPELIIADEPVSALDVSVQVQILNLMRDIKDSMGLSYLFVAHDLAVVRYMCDRVMVMYLGSIMEEAPAEQLFAHPAHPYTEALLSAVPDVERQPEEKRLKLKGDVPSPLEDIKGCPFHPRCHRAKEVCASETPELKVVRKGHCSACHFAAEMLS
jgi:oligopeptide/dipeptide ABC transporter ATP-binding protein